MFAYIIWPIKCMKHIVMHFQRLWYNYYLSSYCKVHRVRFNERTVRFTGHARLLFERNSFISIGEHFHCVSGINYGIDNVGFSKITVRAGSKLIIGHHTGMTNSVIQCHEQIQIGNYVNIGAGCIIADSNFHSLNWKDRVDGTDIVKKKNSPVHIKDYAFIGMRCIILKGVTIGEKSIVAAGSVVVKDVPDNEIWGVILHNL